MVAGIGGGVRCGGFGDFESGDIPYLSLFGNRYG
jgi:hypothetical protein